MSTTCLIVDFFHQRKPSRVNHCYVSLGIWSPNPALGFFSCLLEAQHSFSGLNGRWLESTGGSYLDDFCQGRGKETLPPDFRRDWDRQMNRSQEKHLGWDNDTNRWRYLINWPRVLVCKKHKTCNTRVKRWLDHEKYSYKRRKLSIWHN